MAVVAIVEYGMSNLDSVARAIEYCGATPLVTDQPQDLAKATHIILPGVGAFNIGMTNLRARGFEEALNEHVIHKAIPFLGICLGMQFLANKGCEAAETPGLGWIEGQVVRLKGSAPEEKVPHVGWNCVDFAKASPLLEQIDSGKDFYFVHSFHLACANPDQVLTTTPYCGKFVSAVNKENIFGVQFHPEKSQKAGFQIIRNFLAL
ncbi:MAG: imidazole glycerol phosphate synthase subunit HisH [Proteobacteria bacterium]|nr:imidazole glycerol phosphate synthase subunit HisH [Pseudomonadota bacterium]